MALAVYSIGEIVVGGKFLSNEASMAITRRTNSQAVLTVALGYAGESPGAPMTEVEVTNCVPSAGFEMDPGQYMGDGAPGGQQVGLQSVQFTVFAATQRLVFNGFIVEDNFSHAVNSEAKLSFKARGEFALRG
jgi:hypothetical protein